MTERSEIVALLAKASHETWLRQKERDQLVPREQLPIEVTDHDVERAEDALRALEAHGASRGSLARHWHKEPAESTGRFVEAVPLLPTPKGLKVVLEVTAYTEGTKIAVVPSVVEGPNHNRTIRQRPALRFNNADEAKDAIDAIIDHLEREAKGSRR